MLEEEREVSPSTSNNSGRVSWLFRLLWMPFSNKTEYESVYDDMDEDEAHQYDETIEIGPAEIEEFKTKNGFKTFIKDIGKAIKKASERVWDAIRSHPWLVLFGVAGGVASFAIGAFLIATGVGVVPGVALSAGGIDLAVSSVFLTGAAATGSGLLGTGVTLALIKGIGSLVKRFWRSKNNDEEFPGDEPASREEPAPRVADPDDPMSTATTVPSSSSRATSPYHNQHLRRRRPSSGTSHSQYRGRPSHTSHSQSAAGVFGDFTETKQPKEEVPYTAYSRPAPPPKKPQPEAPTTRKVKGVSSRG